MKRKQRLVVVSNRLPITISFEAGRAQANPSSGGLVTALSPVLESVPSTWIGWTGTDYSPAVEESLTTFQTNYKIVPVYLTASERKKYYEGYSNQVLWPLCHDLLNLCNFDATFWPAYESVNEKFADAVTANSEPGDLIWVHDCHLMLVGDYLRHRHLGLQLAYFHHIPFPSPDIFSNLPSGKVLLKALLRFDSLGFQTRRDRHNFVQCIRTVFGRKARFHGAGSDLFVDFEGNRTCVKASAVSIDVNRFRSLAGSNLVKTRVEALNGSFGDKQIILGVDRLDYTKGIQQRLSSYRLLLERHPELQRKIVFLQLIVPSREHVPEYEALKVAIERQVGEINGAFGQPDWTPVVYMHRNISCEELAAWYQIASAMLVTSRKDGMNLVAKEYCTCKLDGTGALVLSKFAGAAEELKTGAFLVNPNDREELADACFCALKMNRLELRRRMLAMQQTIRNHDALRWFSVVLEDRSAENLRGVIGLKTANPTEIVA